MAQPVWITPAGNLGTVPEGVFYKTVLATYEPTSAPVYYQVIAGDLPQGIEVTKNGIIQGVPSATVTPGSEQIQTGRDVISKFAVRAYTTTIVAGKPVVSRIADRTFELVVASQNYPRWITAAGPLAELIDGTYLSPGIQLEYTDDNTSSQPDISLVSGSLPPGLSISSTGLISGIVIPNPGTNALAGYASANVTGVIVDAVDIVAGEEYIINDLGNTNWILLGSPYNNPRTEFEATGPGTGTGTAIIASTAVYSNNQEYSQYAFDFLQQSISYNYEFTLQVTDGKTSALRTFSIFVISANIFNASTTELRASNTLVTADASSVPSPLVLNPQGSIGSYRNDNFFAYQFFGAIVNGDQLNFLGVDIPQGLTLDPITGWMYGYIPNLGLTELTFDFTVYAYSTVTAGLISDPYNYSITFVGPISTAITWTTPPDLGTIANGSVSKLYVEAISTAGLELQYTITDGQLPDGLRLLQNGLIVGRASFSTFALDLGTTTFDNNTTTFDGTFTFTVNAFSINGLVSVFQTFTISVLRVYNEPYNNLYIQCMPPRDDRLMISNLLQDPNVFPPSLLYRADDPYFGLSTNVKYNHAFGLTAATQDEYVQSLDLNHYWKNLVLGNIKTAQALDQVTGEVIYEVVYSEIIDDLVNNNGVSVLKEVPIAYPIDPNTSDEIDVVYPNALVDMRTQVIDVVGQVSNILPEWMLTKQVDGTILGFQPAWVIAYTVPGASGQIAYNITSKIGTALNLIDFKADRYEIDRSMSVDWDPETFSLPITNIVADGSTSTVSFAAQPSAPFNAGDMINIEGVTPSFFNGTFYVNTCFAGNAIANVAGNVTFNSDVVGVYSTGGTVSSTPHWGPITPIIDTSTQAFDRYLLYPKRNILE